jgi:hypothetical protein
MTRTEIAGHISAEDGWKHVWEWAGHKRQAMGSACRQVQQIGIAQNTKYILHNGYSYKNIEMRWRLYMNALYYSGITNTYNK